MQGRAMFRDTPICQLDLPVLTGAAFYIKMILRHEMVSDIFQTLLVILSPGQYLGSLDRKVREAGQP